MILENVRVSFVHVVEPEENLSGDLKYSCQVHIEKDDKANLARVNAGVEKAIAKGKSKSWGGKKPKFRYEPLRDGDAELKSGDVTDKSYEGVMFLNASKDPKYGKVGLVDENLAPIIDSDKIYSGCYCNVDVNPFPYSNSGNNGVGWGLSNVMFVEDGDRLDGQQSANEAFASLAPETAEEATDFDN